jgi:hypothetical protein
MQARNGIPPLPTIPWKSDVGAAVREERFSRETATNAEKTKG